MNFYIILPIWFLFIFLIRYYQDKLKFVITDKKIELMICIPLLAFASFRGYMRYMWDTNAYIRIINEIPLNLSYLSNIPLLETHEIGFKYIVFFLKQISSNYIFVFFVFALVSIFCFSYFFKKHSINYFYSMFLFIFSFEFASWILNGMRQGFVMAIIYAITPLFFRRKYLLYIGIVLLLFTIHNSALFILPAMFACKGKIFNKKIIIFLIFMFFVCIAISRFTPILLKVIPTYAESFEYYAESGTGMNVMRLLFFSIPTFIACLNYKYIKSKNNMFINFCVNMSIVTCLIHLFACLTSGILVGRVAAYYNFYNFLLLPWEIKHLYNKKLFNFNMYHIMNIVIVLLYIGFYVFTIITRHVAMLHHFEVY